jgi:K+-transporting ATPase A subunit
MVGRTPEFMGKKVEAREVKIAMITALLSPLLIMGGTAFGCLDDWCKTQACPGSTTPATTVFPKCCTK